MFYLEGEIFQYKGNERAWFIFSLLKFRGFFVELRRYSEGNEYPLDGSTTECKKE